jgi:dihydrolipoamide dehydrogenase
METFDVVVIGGGPGGYPAAIRAAQLGASVALVEREQLGGTCLNWGCIPTKTLLAASDLYARIAHGEAFGIKVGKASFDYGAMSRRKDEVVTKLRGGIGMLLKSHGVKVFNGTGSLVDRTHVKVKSGDGDVSLESRRIILATGSVSTVPGFIPKHDRVVESRAFLENAKLPASMIVLGGGVIGCEFACMAAQLGCKVTVVEMLEDILAIMDADVRREVRSQMEKQLGIRVLTGTPLEKIEAGTDGVSGKVGDEKLEAEMLLVAIGRRPYTEGLGLEKVGIEKNKAGFIDTDSTCRTSVANIFAIGDVTGRIQLAHAATAQGVCAAENAMQPKQTQVETLVPSCIFTAPEIGSVGMTEQQAKDAGIEIQIGKFMFAALGKAMAMGEAQGFVKWVVRADNDQLIGAHAVGPHATELISEAAVAIRTELTASELGRTVHCHPTLSEAWMEAAHAVHGTCVHAPATRKKASSAG